MEESIPDISPIATQPSIISRQRKTVYVLAGVILVLISISVVGAHFEKSIRSNSTTVSITPTPPLVTIAPKQTHPATALLLKTTDGDIEIYRGVEERRVILGKISVLDTLIFFVRDNNLGIYDKSTKSISYMDIPAEIVKHQSADDLFSVYVTPLNADLFLVNFNNNTLANSITIYSKNDATLTSIPSEEQLCYIFCSYMYLDHSISDTEHILLRGVGDACWNKGTVYYLDTVSKTIDEIMDYENGCSAEADSYNGGLNDMVIASTHEWQEYPDDLYGHRNLHQSLYALTPDGQKTVLLDESEFPDDITYIYTLDNEEDVFLLTGQYELEDTKFYRYNLQTDAVTQVDRESFPNDTFYGSESSDSVLEQNSEYIQLVTY